MPIGPAELEKMLADFKRIFAREPKPDVPKPVFEPKPKVKSEDIFGKPPEAKPPEPPAPGPRLSQQPLPSSQKGFPAAPAPVAPQIGRQMGTSDLLDALNAAIGKAQPP